MKRMIVTAILALAGISAQAGMNVIVRGDYVNTPKFDNRNGTETPGSSIFRSAAAKVGLDGKVGDAVVTGRLDVGFAPVTTASGDALVEYIYISREIASGFTMHAGKLRGQNGGFEGDSVVDADVYLATLANGGIGGYNTHQIGWTGAYPSPTTGALTIVGTPVTAAGNSRGVGMTYKMGEQAIDLQVTNSTNHGTTSSYTRNNIGVYYKGSFADKMIMPQFGYMAGSSDQGYSSTGVSTGSGLGYEETFVSAGAKMKFGMVGVLAEYLSNTKKASATGGKADNVNSIYALVDYTIDAWKPFLKIESSEFKSQDDATLAASFKRTGMGLGVELTPKAGDAFRYHLAYSSTSDKYGTAGSKETVAWAQLTVGVKYAADILK